MAQTARSSPRCIIIAGPNGAGKTTFAREFLTKEAGVIHFVNPDLIAGGLSPLRPDWQRSPRVDCFSGNSIGSPEPERSFPSKVH